MGGAELLRVAAPRAEPETRRCSRAGGERLASQESGYGRRRAGGVREQSLLDEMRAAVRGDRQRAEQRRAREPVVEASTYAEPPQAEPGRTEPPPRMRPASSGGLLDGRRRPEHRPHVISAIFRSSQSEKFSM